MDWRGFLSSPPVPAPILGGLLPPYVSPPKRRVFIVHGHHLGILAEVENFVLKANWSPVVLKEASHPGKNLLDELIRNSAGVSLAIVILTADDVGRSNSQPQQPLRARGRQNAIFEFGFFVRQLGKNRVFVLHHQDVELPSDYAGVIYVPYDTSGAWRGLLARAIKGAGVPISLAAVI